MPDDRPLKVKLEAMAADTSSPAEAAIARDMLAAMKEAAPRIETSRVLTREAILGSPNVARDLRGLRFRMQSGRWVHCYADEAPWELIETMRLSYRWDGSSETITPTASARPPQTYS